jgi:hypothetical protein
MIFKYELSTFVQCLQMIFRFDEIVLKEKFYENDISLSYTHICVFIV